MNEQKTAVITDSGCDLPADLARELDIRVIPLHVIYPEKDYEDGTGIDPLTVYRRFPGEIPTAATPSQAEIRDLLEKVRDEGYEKAVAVTISGALSGTGNAIRLAAEDVTGLETFVYDTKNISFGSGIFAIYAAKLLQNGLSFEEVCRKLVEKRADSKVLFYMDTLAYLKKGGRIGKVTGTIGEVLRIKPIISCNPEGVYYTVAMARGAACAMTRLVSEVTGFVKDRNAWLILGDGDAKEAAGLLAAKITEKLPHVKVLFEKQITASMAVHTGPGLLGVMMFVEP